MVYKRRMGLRLHLPTTTLERPREGDSKFLKPPWAHVPTKGVALHVIEDGSTIKTLQLDCGAMYYMFGRAPKCACQDGKPIVLGHSSLSRQHAVIVHADEETLYVVDLESVTGTFVVGNHTKTKLDPYVPMMIKNGSIICFGASSRRYLVRTFPKADRILEERDIKTSSDLMAGMSVSCEEEDLQKAQGDIQTRVHTNLNSMVSYAGGVSPHRHLGFQSRTSEERRRRSNSDTEASSNGLFSSSEWYERGRSQSAATNGNKRTALRQGPFTRERRKSAMFASDRRVSFSNNIPELIPCAVSRRKRMESSGSSSSDEDVEETCVVFDAKKDLPDLSIDTHHAVAEKPRLSPLKELSEHTKPVPLTFDFKSSLASSFNAHPTTPGSKTFNIGITKESSQSLKEKLSRTKSAIRLTKGKAGARTTNKTERAAEVPFVVSSPRFQTVESPRFGIPKTGSFNSLKSIQCNSPRPSSPRISSAWKIPNQNVSSPRSSSSVAHAAAAFSSARELRVHHAGNSLDPSRTPPSPTELVSAASIKRQKL